MVSALSSQIAALTLLTSQTYSCKDCIIAFIERCREKGEQGKCPTCSRGPVEVCLSTYFMSIMLKSHSQESDLLEVVRSRQNSSDKGEDGTQAPTPSVTLRRNDFRSSTKLEALVQDLRTQGVYQ